jgi:hypothetical protein
MGMKIKYLSVILIVIILAAVLSGCGPYEQRLQDGTLVASGQDPAGRLAGFGGSAEDEEDSSTGILDLIQTQLPVDQDEGESEEPTATPEPTQTLLPASSAPPTATVPAQPSATIPWYELTSTALIFDLTAITSWTPTPTGTLADTSTPVPGTPVPTEVPCLAFRFIADVTYPPGTSVPASTTFYKSWYVQNVGSCTWDGDYALMFYDGWQLGGTTPMKLGPGTRVEPGQAVTLTIQLWTSPQSGYFTSLWMMQDDAGVIFGGGPNQNEPLLVRVYVPGTGPPEFTAPASTAPPFYTSTPGP